jgi:hypothetical protein
MDAPMNPNMNASSPAPRSNSTGFIIATLVLLAVIVAGGIYFWRAHGDSAADNAALREIKSQSSSDDTASIEADLEATDVNSVDYDLDESNFTAS